MDVRFLVTVAHVSVFLQVEAGAGFIVEVDEVDDLVLDRDGTFRDAVELALDGEVLRPHVVIDDDGVADLVKGELRRGFRFHDAGELLVVGAVFLVDHFLGLFVQRLQVGLFERHGRNERHMLFDVLHDVSDDLPVGEIIVGGVAVDRGSDEVGAVVGELVFRCFESGLVRRIAFRGGVCLARRRRGFCASRVCFARRARLRESGRHAARCASLRESGGHPLRHPLREIALSGHGDGQHHAACGKHASKNPSRVLHFHYSLCQGLWIMWMVHFPVDFRKKLGKHHTLT